MVKQFKGFTLMELMIVMAIIAIASAVIIPRIGSSEAKLFRAQLRTLNAVMNYNRRSAVIMNRPFEMIVFPHSEAREEGEGGAAKKVKQGDWVSQGADIQWQSGTQTIQNKVFRLTYFPQGGATGGIIKLQQGRFIARLIVDGITGKVTIEETTNESDS